MSDVERVLQQVDDELPKALERLFELLSIDSISTDPAYKDSCVKAADWLVEDLRSIGFETQRHATPGHPMVVGHQTGANDKGPHLLFYGHYDVQPVDPLELWNKPPFEPAIEDTEKGQVIRARGAADDKGQLMTFVEACRAWKQVTGSLPTQVSLFFEGEEESGSPSLIPFMEANKSMLTADLALVCDTGMWDSETPTISTMLRGMVGEEITITGPSLDLHSGMYGGPAINPIRVLTRILSDLHDDEGRITLPGFYEGVPEITAELREQWASLSQDGNEFLESVGLSTPAGEKDFSVLEQIWARPTCDVNGISGGYTGAGFKTVLPSKAMAKVSFRLVGDQDPVKIQQSLYDFIEARLPPDCTATYLTKDGSKATVMPVDAPAFRQAHKALSDEWQKEAVYAGCGGSIPVVGHIKQILGMDSLLIGFMLDDDAIHSPNEKYSLNSYHKGIRSWVRILDALSQDEAAT
ncbi:M20/M25/M40 family metallo-hydrolase [Granulosicoccus antarcticus]|uniref:Succinyl-diaminopimelate desuccinylase n=1 Tax=Granulosicoccus antarcticus IMCC3135 TaxID=1192854 RepID=A0A2Z2NTG4_9GAMM|nr:M20/M25/M40 family metallo-hydrolase [Granulosicoccus antarcticus]ASJ74842.1 Succinyl-diaminopimelate desuccinylase [Granulosicoccus antarcticus IMCC3135]